ncbi:MAG: WD40 repeat domain-containing protein [Planctomycetota bacterium]|jgi:WD40 repeat protein
MRALYLMTASVAMLISLVSSQSAQKADVTTGDDRLELIERTVCSIPIDRDQFPCTVDNDGSINLIGGFREERKYRTYWTKVSPDGQNVLQCPNVNFPRRCHCAVRLDNKQWIFGGEDRDGNVLASVQFATEQDDFWRDGPKLPVKLKNASALVVDGTVILIGGETTSAKSSDIYQMSKEKQGAYSWKKLAKFKKAISHVSALKLADGRVLIAGGETDDGLSAACFILDGKKVEKAPALPFASKSPLLGRIDFPSRSVVALDPNVKNKGTRGARLSSDGKNWMKEKKWAVPSGKVVSFINDNRGLYVVVRPDEARAEANIVKYEWDASWVKLLEDDGLNDDDRSPEQFKDLLYTKDGGHLIAGTDYGRLIVYETKGYQIVHETKYEGNIREISTSGDGSHIAVLVSSKDVVVLDTSDWKEVKRTKLPQSARWIDWSPTDDLVVATKDDNDHRTILINPMTGEILKSVEAKSNGILTDCKFTPDGKHIVIPDKGGTVNWYDAKTLERKWSVRITSSILNRVDVSADGKYVATSAMTGRIFLIDAKTREVAWRGQIGTTVCRKIRFSADSRFVMTGNETDEYSIFDTANGTRAKRINANGQHYAQSVAWHPDGRTVAMEGQHMLNVFRYKKAVEGDELDGDDEAHGG